MTETTQDSCIKKTKESLKEIYRAPCFWIKTAIYCTISLLIILGLLTLVRFALDNFTDAISYTYMAPERLGQFGDFLGGTLNPIFGFLTVCILVLSIFIQRKELKESAKALNNQVTISTNEYNRKQLESTIDELQKRYNEILNESFPQVIIIYEDATDAQCMPEKITRLIELMRIMAHKIGDIKQPTNILNSLKKNNTSFTSEIIRNANCTLKLMINLFEDLIEITKKESVEEYWRFRAKTLIDQACLVAILDTDEKDELYKKIGIYL